MVTLKIVSKQPGWAPHDKPATDIKNSIRFPHFFDSMLQPTLFVFVLDKCTKTPCKMTEDVIRFFFTIKFPTIIALRTNFSVLHVGAYEWIA